MNDSPKKVARHSLLAINCRKTKGIKTDWGIVWRLANFVTQPEIELNMGWYKLIERKREGGYVAFYCFHIYFLTLYYIYKNTNQFGSNGGIFYHLEIYIFLVYTI